MELKMNRRSFLVGLTTTPQLMTLSTNSMQEATNLALQRHASRILHITAGDDQWEPTDKELQQIADLFTQADTLAEGESIGSVIVTRSGVEAVQYELFENSVTLITAGTDEWQPTQEELNQLRELWLAASDDPKGNVIVTHQGVTLTQLDLTQLSLDELSLLTGAVAAEVERRKFA
jgi:hypothetical protein